MSATSYATEQQAILGRLDDNWRDAGSLKTPIAWPNSGFEPTVGTAYIEPRVNRQAPFNTDIAPTKRIRHPGLLTVDIRVPVDQGDAAAFGFADDVVAIYRNVTFDSITFRVPDVNDLGREGNWYRVQVDCPYHRDSIH